MSVQHWSDYSPVFRNERLKAVFSHSSLLLDGKEDRQQFASVTGLNPSRLIIPQQIHSTNVSVIRAAGRVNNLDGVFSANPDLICSVQVADCLPIYFVHKSEVVFGLVHAGWRGLVNGILWKSSKLLMDHGQLTNEFEILIGPSIKSCCFEVSDDVINQFNPAFVENKGNGKYRIDLQEMALNQLMSSGFQKDNITVLSDCTSCKEDKYHSYRRNGKKAGRMIGLLGMK